METQSRRKMVRKSPRAVNTPAYVFKELDLKQRLLMLRLRVDYASPVAELFQQCTACLRDPNAPTVNETWANVEDIGRTIQLACDIIEGADPKSHLDLANEIIDASGFQLKNAVETEDNVDIDVINVRERYIDVIVDGFLVGTMRKLLTRCHQYSTKIPAKVPECTQDDHCNFCGLGYKIGITGDLMFGRKRLGADEREYLDIHKYRDLCETIIDRFGTRLE